MRFVRGVLFFFVFYFSMNVEAQLIDLGRFRSKPTEVEVKLEHPPQLSLDVDRVAFGPETGECAGDFVDQLQSDFIANGIEVLDRHNVQALLNEHKFALSGVVDRTSAADLGNILGPAALVFVDVRRCTTEKDAMNNHRRSLYSGKTRYSYISRTRAFFKASLKIVDLTTGSIHSAVPIETGFSRSNNSSAGRPEYYSEYDAIDTAIRQAVSKVHNLFFPWTETKTLKFHAKKDCNLKLAYNLVLAGDFIAARKQSRTNAKACENEKPKIRARAHYNFGMTLCLLEEFDAAEKQFRYSLNLRPDDTTSEAMAACAEASRARDAMDQYATAEALEETSGIGSMADRAPSIAHPSESADAPRSVETRLRQLKELHKQGLINDKEYASKRDEVLADL